MRADAAPLPNFSPGQEAYFRIHKQLVGPKTAERLSLLCEELSTTQDPRSFYEAGWAAAEAAIVGEALQPEDREKLLQATEACWDYSLMLEQERAATAPRAIEKGYPPDRTAELRIATALAAYPIIRQLPFERPSKNSLREYRINLARVGQDTLAELGRSVALGSQGRIGTYKGLAKEHIVEMLFARLESSRLLAIPSLARADSGLFYPEQTHDIQVLAMDGDKIVSAVPLESKPRFRPRFSARYDAALICGRDHLAIQTPADAAWLLAALIDETQRGAAPDVTAYLEQKTAVAIHVIRHHKRARDFGRHCPGMSDCHIPMQRSSA